MTAAELLEQLNTLDEHERVEAKRASEIGKSLLETVCAFANEPGLDGGWILLGAVREELASFPAYGVEGIAQPDKHDAKALVFVKEAGVIDNATYRELTGVDALAASQALRRLRDAGLLTQQGRSSATHYVPTAKLLPAAAATPALSSNPPGLSSNPSGLSSNPVPGKPSGARDGLLAQVPGNVAARIGALGQRNPPDEVRAIVLALCAQRAWRAEELATLLQRNTEYVRSNYLRPLLRSGRLQMTNPQDVNDPQQAYRAASGGSKK